MLADEIREFGWSLVPGVIDPEGIEQLRAASDLAVQHPLALSRRGSAYGLRNLLPAAHELAWSVTLLGEAVVNKKRQQYAW